jgi:hypothetical protein
MEYHDQVYVLKGSPLLLCGGQILSGGGDKTYRGERERREIGCLHTLKVLKVLTCFLWLEVLIPT